MGDFHVNHKVRTPCLATYLLFPYAPRLRNIQGMMMMKKSTDTMALQMHQYTLIPKVLYLRRWGKKFSLSFGNGRVTYS